MPLVTLEEMKRHLSLTPDQTDDDALISDKIDAAQRHIERLLGFEIARRLTPVPADIKEAIMQLAAWWFDNREAIGDVSRVLPFGVDDIVKEYRDWTF